jgi:hypothetical protein
MMLRFVIFIVTAPVNPLLWNKKQRKPGMHVTVEIPDDIASRISKDGSDLSRHALEALAAEEYRKGHLHKPDLRRLLGFETSYEIDGFLKAHNIHDEYTLEEFERERTALKSLGL